MAAEASSAPAAPQRRLSLDQEALEKLEKRLQRRPEKSELVDKNILKDDRVAPKLQATKEALEKQQLHDKLEHAIQQRPSPDELVKGGILEPDEAPELK